MASIATGAAPRLLDPMKFRDPDVTAKGEPRARVGLTRLHTLWFNTGTLCNITCANCYIESSPTNGRLVYLKAAEVASYLDELAADPWAVEEIGFTGGEPFMNPDIIAMLGNCLGRGYRVLVLTNAMRPMMRRSEQLRELGARYGDRLVLRVSIDHYTAALHDRERGPGSWEKAVAGLEWLLDNGFHAHVAGRTFSGEAEAVLRAGYARLFASRGFPIDAYDPQALVLFPEMDPLVDVPEISESCWGILGVAPEAVMCATSRMVAKRKGAERPVVLACTLLPYDPQFEIGATLADATGEVRLNHPHCARFCVLGGGSCSPGD